MKVSAETEPVPLEEVMVETGKNEALAAAFPFLSFPFLSFPLAARLCICLFSRIFPMVFRKSIAFCWNTSCLLTLAVLCIVGTIAPIMATNKIRLDTGNKTR